MRRRPRLLLALSLNVSAVAFARGPTLAQSLEEQLDQKLKAAAASLSDAFAKDAVFGQFVERAQGAYVFAPEDQSLPILVVENPEQISEIAVGPKVSVSAQIDLENRTVKVSSYELDARFALGTKVLNTSEPVKDAAESARNILSRLEIAAKPGAMSVNERTLDTKTDLGKATLKDMASFASAYRAALDAQQLADAGAIAKQWRELRAQIVAALPEGADPEYKTLYGAADNYAPWRYDLIFTQATSVVALGEPGKNTSLCSGVLISEDIVLTAGHCFSGPPIREPGQLEVWFGYAENPDGGSSPQ